MNSTELYLWYKLEFENDVFLTSGKLLVQHILKKSLFRYSLIQTDFKLSRDENLRLNLRDNAI